MRPRIANREGVQMQCRTTVILAVVLGVVMFSVVAHAAEPYDISYCSYGTVTMVSKTEELTVFSADVKGISWSNHENKAFDNNTYHCVSVVRVSPSERAANGYCKFLEPNGDFVVGEFRSVNSPQGNWKFLQGTGKWKGITGGGTNEPLRRGKPIAPGTFQSCRRATGTYTLPD
jgi:hypothetical protein